MNRLVQDEELLKQKYKEMQGKISNLLKEGLIMKQCIMINTLKLT